MTTDQPARYRRTPADIEAVQWTGTNTDALRAFAGSDFDTIDPEDRIEDPDQDAQLLVEASHWVGIKPGDWVVKYEGYFVAKADATFRAVWEPAAVSVPPSAGIDRRAQLLDALDFAYCQGLGYHSPDALLDAYDAERATPVPPSADQTALRDRIAEAMREHYLCTNREEADADGNLPCRCGDWREPGAEVDDENDWDSHLADAVLAVLPEPTNRATLLREVAEALYAHDHLGWHVSLRESDVEPVYRERAAAVLAVLPAPADGPSRVAAEEQPAPCAECGHPRTVHRAGDDPVTPGECSACPDDDARHDHRPAVGEQHETQEADRG